MGNRAVQKSGSAFITEYQTVYNSWAIKPNDIVAAAQNAMVEGWVNTGVWIKEDVIYIYAIHTNDNGEALVNWKNPGAHDAILVNAPAFTAFEGFKGDEATKYIDLNYNPFTQGVNYTLNDASFSVYSRTEVNELTVDLGLQISANIAYTLLRASNLFHFRVNSIGGVGAVNLSSLGMFNINRLNSTNQEGYVNKIKIGDNLVVSSSVPNGNFNCLRRGGIQDIYSSRQLSYADIGGGLTQQNINDKYDYFQAYMASNGNEV